MDSLIGELLVIEVVSDLVWSWGDTRAGGARHISPSAT